jgi:hypothetical protein
MRGIRRAYKILAGKYIWKRQYAKRKRRCNYNIKLNLIEIGSEYVDMAYLKVI